MKTLQNTLIVFFKAKWLVNLSAKLLVTNYGLKLCRVIPLAFILIFFSANLKAQKESQPKPIETIIYTKWKQLWPQYKTYLQKTVDTTDVMLEGEFIKQIAEFDKDSIEYYYRFYKVKYVLNAKTAISDTAVVKEPGYRIGTSGIVSYDSHRYVMSQKAIFCATIIRLDTTNIYDKSIKHLTFVSPVQGTVISMYLNDTLYATMGYSRNLQFYTYNDLKAFLKHIKHISIPPVWEKTIDAKKATTDSLNNIIRQLYFQEKQDIENYNQQHSQPQGKIKTFFKIKKGYDPNAIKKQWSDLHPYTQQSLKIIADTSSLILQAAFIGSITIFEEDSQEYNYRFLKIVDVIKGDLSIKDTIMMCTKRYKPGYLFSAPAPASGFAGKEILFFTYKQTIPKSTNDSIRNLNYTLVKDNYDFSFGFLPNDSIYACNADYRIAIPTYKAFKELCAKAGIKTSYDWDLQNANKNNAIEPKKPTRRIKK